MTDYEHTSEAVAPQWDRASPMWQRVSMKYAWSDFILNVLFGVVLAAVFFVVARPDGVGLPPLLVVLSSVVILAVFVNAFFAFRRVRSIGYCLRDDDLLFRRGILFERVVAVPYGRLQLVDVTRGPLLRALGLASLKFVTASAATGVQLPGLTLAEAETLRDRLVELAETRRSGL